MNRTSKTDKVIHQNGQDNISNVFAHTHIFNKYYIYKIIYIIKYKYTKYRYNLFNTENSNKNTKIKIKKKIYFGKKSMYQKNPLKNKSTRYIIGNY